MGTTSIFSGFSTAGLAHVKIAEGQWKALRSTADLHVMVIEGPHPINPPCKMPILTRQELAARLKVAGKRGAIAMTVDTFLMLALELQVIAPSEVTTVFPWPADEPCARVPEMTSEADAICRDVASFYHSLSHRRLIDQHGKVERFLFKAANTVSLRAHASYFNIRQEDRAKFKPIAHHETVVQFDWTVAEWSLVGRERCDVCVVGAGIAGLTAAYHLAAAGRAVLVIDAGGIGDGESRRTSAHLVSVPPVMGDSGCRWRIHWSQRQCPGPVPGLAAGGGCLIGRGDRSRFRRVLASWPGSPGRASRSRRPGPCLLSRLSPPRWDRQVESPGEHLGLPVPWVPLQSGGRRAQRTRECTAAGAEGAGRSRYRGVGA